MIKKNYYALYDNQLNEISSIGFNATSQNSLREYLVSYLLLGNFSKEGEKSIKRNTLSELLNYYEFRLLESSEPFRS